MLLAAGNTLDKARAKSKKKKKNQTKEWPAKSTPGTEAQELHSSGPSPSEALKETDLLATTRSLGYQAAPTTRLSSPSLLQGAPGGGWGSIEHTTPCSSTNNPHNSTPNLFLQTL